MLHSLYIPFQFFHPPIWRGFLSLYSQSNCILALRLYSQGASIGCLSHQSFAGGGRMCCELWDYCLRVIFSLMRPAELVQDIECRGDGYFTWPSFGCLSHQGFAGGGRVCCELWDYCSRVISSLMRPVELVQDIECGGDGYFTWPSFGCLSHQSFAGGGRVYCELWDYCLRVTSLLMWLVELVQCIECGGDSYFTWIFSFFFTCTSLPSSSVSCHLVQVACLTLPKIGSLIGLLRESASLSFLLGFSSVCWVRT